MLPELADYQVKEALHRSGRTAVWRARRQDGAAVVLKTSAAAHPSRRDLLALRHEYDVLRRVESSGVVRALDLIDAGGRPVLVLEDMGGLSLQRIAAQRRLGLGAVLRVVAGAAASLAEVHRRGLVHGDIKPANLVVTPGLDRQQLIDFALASPTRQAREGAAGQGTMAYMAPEQTGRTGAAVDGRSDLYALGVTLFELLTGRLPFPATDPLELIHSHLARRPPLVTDLSPDVPHSVGQIVDRLLRKSAAERYQTAAGLAADLRRCTQGAVDGAFELGADDEPEGFEVPRQLRGRERQLGRLQAAFVRSQGRGPEVVAVRGASGEGKTALVSEMQATVAAAGGSFAQGKAAAGGQVPFGPVVAALGDVFRQMLVETDDEVAVWRRRLLRGWGAGAGVMTELVPEAELLLGPQPPAPGVEPAQALHRLRTLFAALGAALAEGDRPLLLFLDDLQWADSATLWWLRQLGGAEGGRGVLVVVAYRGEEVGAEHPLGRVLDELRQGARGLDEIELGPLDAGAVTAVVASAVRRPASEVEGLGRLVLERTGGNPYFVGQFLRSLHDDGALRFDPALRGFRHDEGRVHEGRYTENVLDLTLGRLRRLPPGSLRALRAASCLGARFSLAALASVLAAPAAEVARALGPAAEQGLVVAVRSDPGEESFLFLHDRVQQTVLGLADEGERAGVHLAAARHLEAVSPGASFEIARHYQAAAGRLDEVGRRAAAGAQLRAAQAARASAAYAEALGYCEAGLGLAAGAAVGAVLVRSLRLEQAEALASTGAFAAADQAFAALTEEAPDAAERARVTARRLLVLAALGRHREVLALTRREAAGLGLELPGDEPAAIEAAIARDRVFLEAWRGEGGELPGPGEREPDLATRALLRLLGLASTSSFTVAPRLHRALVLATVRCAIERGVDASCAVAFGQLGHLLGEDDGDFREGHRFARLGVALAERAGDLVWASKASVMLGGYCTYWAEPVAGCAAPLERGLRGAIDTGDALWAGFAGSFLSWSREVAGEPLDDVLREAEEQLALSRRARLDILTWDTLLLVRLVAALQGRTPSLSSLDGDGFDEAESAGRMAALERKTPYSTYLVFKAQALVYAGDFEAALAVARQAAGRAWSFAGWTHSAKRCFYHLVALAWSAPAPRAPADLDELDGLARQLDEWARSCPANFEHMALLAAAERARLTGDPRASGRYEEAADAARRRGLVHDEGLICEAAARHLLALGHHRAAAALLRDADACFLAWGATGKVRQLRRDNAGYLTDAPASSLAHYSSSHSSGPPLGAVLDLASLARATEAISSERSLDRLLHRLLQILVENAGGQLGALVLRHGDEPQVVAALAADGAALAFDPEPLGQSARLPRSLAQLALRTHQDLFIHDALDHRAAATDPYVSRHRVRAVLCLHLRQQGQPTGLVVIEHRLSPGAFPRDRADALRLLATQAAVAVDNARLYARLDEHRRLLEQQVSERTAELRDRNEHLAATLRQLVEGQNRLAGELAEATDYVRARLPEPLRHPGLSIDWRFLPCAELGGDGLGYQWIDDDHLALYVVDVCGHGVASALLSVQILDVLRWTRLPGVDFTDPGAVVQALNRAFPHETHRHLHFTLWYGVYRPSTRALRYLSAGHPPAILLEPGRRPRELATAGPFVGVLPDIDPASDACVLAPGSSLFVFSDGCYEIERPDGTYLDIDDLASALADAASDPDALDRVVTFCAQASGSAAFADDYSMLHARIASARP